VGRGDQPENLAAGEAERHGPHHAGHNTDIVELSDRPIDTEPMYTGAGVEVEDLHAAPRLGIRFGKLAVGSQPLEALVAWFGQADKGIFAIEGKPAHETCAEGEHLELGLFTSRAVIFPGFASTWIGFTITAVPLAQDSALIDAGLDFALGPGMTLGASYSGQIASDLTDNAVKGRFTWLF
jgi:hypothetical protein